MKNKRKYGKKHFTTRLLAGLLAAVMTLTSVDMTAFATESGTDTPSAVATEEADVEDESTDSEAMTEESAIEEEETEAGSDAETEDSGEDESGEDILFLTV